MSKIENLIGLLGEENEKRLKEKVTDFIIDTVKDDFSSYSKECYILDPDEIIEFVDECKKEAFERIKEEVVNNMAEKIKMSIKNFSLND